jgi:ABC-type uncharacterized transport system involved in gliding motility auxiliary subunit
MERKARASTESIVLILVVAGILVALNALGALGMNKRFDTTAAERFTLSKGSIRLLQSLGTKKKEGADADVKQTMQVEAYVTRGLPKLDAFVRDLRDLLQEYQEKSGGKFTYTIIEAKTDDEKKNAKDAGLIEQPFVEASETEEKGAVTKGYMGLVMKYGAEKDAIKALPTDRTDGLEFWITNKVREIRDKADDIKHKIGVVSGKEEIKLSEPNLIPSNQGKPSIQEIIVHNFPFYTLQEVDLKGGETEIDDQLDGLIITQPGKDFNDKELRRIDQFLMKGKALAVFASAVNLKANDPSMNASLNLHNLDKLLDGYGVEMRKDVVLDFGRSFRVPVMTQGGIAAARIPQILDVQDDTRFTDNETLLDTGFAGFFRLPQVALPLTSSLILHCKEKQPDATDCKIVARSTPRSIRKTDDSVDLKPFQAWKPKAAADGWQQYGVAANVEGRLKSAYTGGDNQGVKADAQVAEGKKARIAVISSAQFLANPFARSGNGPEMGGQMGMMMPMPGDEQLLELAVPYAQQALNPASGGTSILAFKNMLDWLTGDIDLLAVSAKILSEPSLVYGDVNKPKFDENETDEQLKKRDEEMKAARKNQQNTIQWTLILLVPLLFSLYGILRWRMRVARRLSVSLA